MTENINEILHQHYFADLKKPEIDKYTRKKIIENYMKEHTLNLSEFSRLATINYRTLVSWTKTLDIEPRGHINIYIPAGKDPLFKILEVTIKALEVKHKNVNDETKEQVKQLEKSLNTFKFRHNM